MTEQEPRKLSIDGTEVLVDNLTEAQRRLVLAIQHLDAQLPELREKLSALQAARDAAFDSLKQTLPKDKQKRSLPFLR